MFSNPPARRFRGSRRTAATNQHERLMDALEQRALFAADLGVLFGTFGNVPQTLIPGDQINLPIIVRNVGDTAAVGNVSIDFLLSTDATFDANDTLIGTFPNEQISLSADGFPNSEGDFSGVVEIPAVAPGNYFFLVRLRPASNVGDFNQSNNVAASAAAQAFAWKFGTFDGRTNATLTLTDPSGTEVSFGLSGGGFGTVTTDSSNDERFDVVLSSTGGASNFVIQADDDTGEGPTAGIALISDITGGTLNSISAPTARLFGDITLSGSLASLRFGNVPASSLITVQGTTVNTAYTFGSVTNLNIVSAAPIASLFATEWTDTAVDSEVSRITAPWMGTLTTNGAFQASLSLTGRTGAGRTLGSASIGGNISVGSWRIVGASGPISARATAANWSASITKALQSVSITLDFRGVLAAKSIATITVGRDMIGARVLAGANLGSDARLGGADGAADTFAAGNITTINIGRKATNVIIGAGLNPVDGVFKNGNDQLVGNGRINRITVVGVAGNGNRFLAPRYTGAMVLSGSTVDPASDVRFMLS